MSDTKDAIAKDAIAGLRGDLTATAASLLQELEGLGRIIATARAEVAALRADGIDESVIPSATDELAAIVSHTAQATHEILADHGFDQHRDSEKIAHVGRAWGAGLGLRLTQEHAGPARSALRQALLGVTWYK